MYESGSEDALRTGQFIMHEVARKVPVDTRKATFEAKTRSQSMRSGGIGEAGDCPNAEKLDPDMPDAQEMGIDKYSKLSQILDFYRAKMYAEGANIDALSRSGMIEM